MFAQRLRAQPLQPALRFQELAGLWSETVRREADGGMNSAAGPLRPLPPFALRAAHYLNKRLT